MHKALHPRNDIEYIDQEKEEDDSPAVRSCIDASILRNEE